MNPPLSTQAWSNIKKNNPLTGSLRKKTSEVRVRMNHLFFQDVHPIPVFFCRGGWKKELDP